jgi:hypothetical protein
VRLRADVDADHVEAGTGIAHRGAAAAREQVEESGFHRSPNLASSQRYAFVSTARNAARYSGVPGRGSGLALGRFLASGGGHLPRLGGGHAVSSVTLP